MKLSNRWFTGGDEWAFHIEDKNIWRRLIDMKTPDLLTLLNLKLKREWTTNDGEGNPPNFEFMEKMFDAYLVALEESGIEVPDIENKILEKVIGFTKTLFRQDSAYYERIGGTFTVLISNPDKWVGKTQAERVKTLESVRKWFKENDKRARTINWMLWFFNYGILKYKSNKFYRWTLDWFVAYGIEHAEEWQIVAVYNPKNWYPHGRGQLNDRVHAGRG